MNNSQLQRLLADRLGVSKVDIPNLMLEAENNGSDLEAVVLRRGIVTKARLRETEAQELGVPYIDVANYSVEPGLAAAVPHNLARRLHVLPLFRVADTLTVAMANPEDITVLDEIRRATKLQVNPVLADREDLRRAIDRCYPARTHSLDASEIVAEAEESIEPVEPELDARALEELASEAPVVRLVNALIDAAAAKMASDIHIEPDDRGLRVRMRIDGVLRDAERLPEHLRAAVVSRIKILSGIDISEKRRPQDGRFEVAAAGRSIDFRVSTFPTVYGENVVLRLLDKSSGPITIAELGMAADIAVRFETIIRQPHGIVLVTGPTGSGKTTTLYGVLKAINSIEKNIVTLEDPVEYRLPLVRHCQVNPKAGVTFASGLRSILRQDPDVIMVGEIRDHETAEIAFQAALTGHLVLSTLHTNDAASGLTRMLDMAVEPFLIASSVRAILAQRLLRRICRNCVNSYEPDRAVLSRLGVSAATAFNRGTGCDACGRTGYRGRIGIFELMPVSPEIRSMVMDRRSSEEVKTQAIVEGMKTLREDALAKALAGLTTPEEVLRVTQDCSE